MKLIFKRIKTTLLVLAATLFLSGCEYGPIYPWVECSSNAPYRPGCYYTGGCTAYHPNYFYRCQNHHCATYSPHAPNKCDPYPFYTGCKYATCCQSSYYTTYP